jgi:hypothetical protein
MHRIPSGVAAIVFAFTFSSTSFAQTFDRGWIDVSLVSAMSAQDDASFVFRGPLYLEMITLTSAYPKLPRAIGPVLGGGVGIVGGLGAAVQFTTASYEYTAGLGITVPHPTFFQRFATDTDVTNSTLERTDNAVDISAVYQVPTTDTWRVRIFGGPTYFSLKQDFVEDIRYSQSFNVITAANVVDIGGFAQREAEGSTWGFHAGGDVAYYFSRHVGVGGGVSLSRGTVALDTEPLSEAAGELKVGWVILGAGLRVRF